MTSMRGDIVNRVRRLPKPTQAATSLHSTDTRPSIPRLLRRITFATAAFSSTGDDSMTQRMLILRYAMAVEDLACDLVDFIATHTGLNECERPLDRLAHGSKCSGHILRRIARARPGTTRVRS